MRGLDLSSPQGFLLTLVGLLLATLIGVGIRLVLMLIVQARRERANRQINERLKTLIAAYKVLGGSFTGDLLVDPTHRRDRRRAGIEAPDGDGRSGRSAEGAERARRVRDAVEAALSDVILLGTAEHVRLATHAAGELVRGRPVHVRDLVVSLRAFVRAALDLEPVPPGLAIPDQGPTRPAAGGRGERGGRGEGGGGGGGGMGAAMMGGGDPGLAPARGADPDDPGRPG